MMEKTILRELDSALRVMKRYKAKNNEKMFDYYSGSYDAFVSLLKELSPEKYKELKFSFEFSEKHFEL